jgi:hypothetical protein
MPERLGYYITKKGYPRYSAGPHRGKYVHRVVLAEYLGRALTKDEDAHHKDGNKLNFSPDNLELMGHREHGWVSAKQHWYMKRKEAQEKEEWEKHCENSKHRPYDCGAYTEEKTCEEGTGSDW